MPEVRVSRRLSMRALRAMSIRSPEPGSPTAALQLFNELPYTPENRRRIVLAYLEEAGDVPLGVEHSFRMTAASSDDIDAMHAMVDELREQHFAKLGKPLPERSGPPLR